MIRAALAVLVALPGAAMAACDWSTPGAAPYPRTPAAIEAAIEAYSDIHPLARADLIARIKGLREDGILLITRDVITSPQGTAKNLRDMHWRDGLCLGAVDRSGWADNRVEPALVYCSLGWCVAVPTVCGNVARVDFVRREYTEPHLRHWDGKPVPINHVPEPGTLLLSLLALAVMGRKL